MERLPHYGDMLRVLPTAIFTNGTKTVTLSLNNNTEMASNTDTFSFGQLKVLYIHADTFRMDLRISVGFEDEGVIQSGASLASVELKEWEGSGLNFTKIRGGSQTRGHDLDS